MKKNIFFTNPYYILFKQWEISKEFYLNKMKESEESQNWLRTEDCSEVKDK